MNRYAIMAIVTLALFALLAVACQEPAPIIVEPMGASPVGHQEVVVSTFGSGYGEALGSTTFGPIGPAYLDAIYIDYRPSISTTTDITLSYSSPAWGDIIVRGDSATDGLFYPRQLPHDTSASSYGDDGLVPWLMDGTFKLSVGESTTMTPCVTMTIYYVRQ